MCYISASAPEAGFLNPEYNTEIIKGGKINNSTPDNGEGVYTEILPGSLPRIPVPSAPDVSTETTPDATPQLPPRPEASVKNEENVYDNREPTKECIDDNV